MNVKDAEGNTPLHLAALNGHSSMVSFLIENGANIYLYADFVSSRNTIV